MTLRDDIRPYSIMAYIRSSRLPPELTDMVIDNLQEDKAALSKASLVAKSWLVRSQVNLFRAVTVTADFRGFTSFLLDKSHISRHIQRLILQGHSCDYVTPPSLSPPPIATLEPTALALILFHLPSLRSLQLHHVSLHGMVSSFNLPSFQLDDLLMMNVGSSHDTTNDILHILGLFSDIRSLTIHSVGQHMDQNDILSRTDDLHIPRSLRVHALKLEDVPCELYMQVFRRTEAVRSLANVDVECEGLYDVEGLAELLRDASATVETLAVNLSQCFSDNSYAGEESEEIFPSRSRVVCETLGSGISYCTKLTTLDVAISLDSCSEEIEGWNCVPGIMNSASASSIRRIEVSLASEESFAPLQELELDWQPLSDALKRFSCLEKVTFGNVPGSSWCFSEQEKEVVRNNLPELVQRGRLRIGH
ncbi:hypothetical protein BC835DRAFT_1524185 [Cytidiella melzeri]|nr:hypothetical protein BC835DRAFT_1524185 [Cytidiella melzeri]